MGISKNETPNNETLKIIFNNINGLWTEATTPQAREELTEVLKSLFYNPEPETPVAPASTTPHRFDLRHLLHH